jgi:hypothetical protein
MDEDEEGDSTEYNEEDRQTEDDDRSVNTISKPVGIERRRSARSEMDDVYSPRRTSKDHDVPHPQASGSVNHGPRGSYTEYMWKSNNSMPRKSGRYDDEEMAIHLSPSACEALSAVYNSPEESLLGTGGYEVNRMHGSNQRTTSVPSIDKVSFVLIAQPRGFRTELVQCTIIRDRSSIHSKLYPTYELLLEEPKKLLITATKMTLNRTSNYHLFDMTRGQVGSKLSKKAGNYLGKLRARNSSRTEYFLLNKSSEREELAGIAFERLSLVDQLKEGNQPRKLKLVLPRLDQDSIPIAHRMSENGSGSLTDLVSDPHLYGSVEGSGLFVFESKDPVFENGNYRLNFRGRVNLPSVKNFQLVPKDDIDHIVCQFGKVDEDIFHLDFKAPLNAFQAFALALCQFNL